MAITKVTSGLISADAASVDLNIDAGTLYIDATNNRVGIANTSPSDALDITGNIVVSGTVDGRDLATDGTKLDGIEANATADQTQSEINALGITATGLSGTPNITVGSLTASSLIYPTSDGTSGQALVTDGSGNLSFSTIQGYTDSDVESYLDGGTSTPTFASATVTGEITANGGIALGTNDKATFGASDTFEIYTDGTDSFIKETAAGSLKLLGTNIDLVNAAGTELGLRFVTNDAVTLYYDGSAKIATTSTGIDVTGTAVVDALTSSGTISSSNSGTDGGQIRLTNTGGGSTWYWAARTTGLNLGELTVADGNIFIENGGNVGIGTTSPQAVGGHTGVLTLYGSNATALVTKNSSSSSRIAQLSSDLAFFVNTYENERMRIDSSGNVGIGTTSPDTALDVTSSGANGIVLNQDTANSAVSGRLFFKDTNGTNAILNISGDLGFFIGGTVGSDTGTERLRIDSSGNVLIGESSAITNNKLVAKLGDSGVTATSNQSVAFLENGTNAWLTIGSGASSYGGILFADSGDSDIGQLRYNHSTNTMEVITNNTTHMSVNDSGIVTMKTTPAQATQERVLFLDVNCTNNQGSGYLEIHSGTNSTAKTRIEQVSSGGSGLYGTYIDTNIINVGNSASAHGNINFITNEAIRMTVGAGPNAGRVGIGTTSPAQKLHVAGSGEVYGRIESTSGGAGKLQIKTDTLGYSAYSSLDFSYGSSDTVAFGISGGGVINTMAFSTGGSQRMSIDSSGNVQINGTSSKFRHGVTTNTGIVGLNCGGAGVNYSTSSQPTGSVYFGNTDGSGVVPAICMKSTSGSRTQFRTATANGATYDLEINVREQDGTDYGTINNAGGIAFTRYGTELTRIFRDGTMLIGSTSGGGGATGDPALQVVRANSSFSGNALQVQAYRPSSSSYSLIQAYANFASDPKFKVRGDGEVTADGSFSGGGADYAEYFEWQDGNSSNEDRVGYVVSLVGNKIKIAEAGETIIGVVSANPSVIGDAQEFAWHEKYEKDDFGRYIFEDYTLTEWTESVDNGSDTPKQEKKSYQTDKIPEGIVPPEDAVIVFQDADGNNLRRQKENSNFDESQNYIPRSERQEWDIIGLMGKVRIKKGQQTNSNWIKLRDISDTVEEWLVR